MVLSAPTSGWLVGWRYWDEGAASASQTALCGARRQFNHRNAAGCLLLILTELRIPLCPPRVDAVVLRTDHWFRNGRVRLVADLDSDLGMGEQVVIPVGVGGPASSGGEDEQSVALTQVHRGVRAALAALGAGGREQQQWPVFPHATDLALIRPELLNRLAIPIIPVRHQFSSCGPRLLDADPIGSASLSHAL